MNPPLPFTIILLTLLTGSACAQTNAHPAPTSHTLEFIENKGQWDTHARYAAPLPGGRLFAEADGLTFALLANGGPAQLGHHGRKGGTPWPLTGPVRGHALTLHFEGANAATRLSAETPTAEHRNYFLGADPKHWARDVRGFRELRYADLWPGVNARVYESADQHLEYDFELAPGAQPAAIGLRHDGAEALTVDASGNLLVKTSVGTIIERAPHAWQTTATGQRQAVVCRYVLAGTVVRFALGKYDTGRPLTIDPVVVFATYSGSVANNWGFTATYDPQGNLYSGGIAFEAGYPANPGAFQTTFAGLIDIAIIKYNTSVSGLAARVWATYLGGDKADFPHSLVVNNQGELLVLGSSGSADYPTTLGALQSTFGGGTVASPFGYGAPYNSPTGSDLVITRLAADGAALVGSTFLGGSGNDGLLPLNPSVSPNSAVPQLAHNYGDPFRGDILVDAADNVYIASHTTSNDFPVARGFSSTYHGGASDGVVCKLTPDLKALIWSSYLGGSGADAAYSIQLEPASGDVYVAGGTLSDDFPVTAGAYHTARPGRIDGFAVRIAAAGTSLLRATYVGTAAYDQAYFLQLSTDGGVYLLGQTTGDFPSTAGLYHTTNGTQFIQKLDANLSISLLSTVFGSANAAASSEINISPTAFLVDRCDRVYVCGWGGQVNQDISTPQSYLAANGTTTGLPTTPGAAQTATDGNDFYLAQFAAGLTDLSYGTFYGDSTPFSEGEHVDGGTSRFDPRGIVYQAVCSCFSATGFPIPSGANTYSVTNNSLIPGFGTGCNNAAFVLNFQPSIANAGADGAVCATAGPQSLTGYPGGGIWTGPGVSGNAAMGYIFMPTTALIGVQVLTYTVPSTGLCTTTGTRRVTVTPPSVVAFSPLLQNTYCLPTAGSPALPEVALTATPTGGTFSGAGVSGSVATGFRFSPNQVPGTYQLVYTLNAGGCLVQATQTVTIGTSANAGANQTVCSNASPLTLTGSPAGGTWAGAGVSGSAATGFVFTPSTALAGVQALTYTTPIPSTCRNTDTLLVTVKALPTIIFTSLVNNTFCTSPEATILTLTATPAGGTFSGQGVVSTANTGFGFTLGLPPGTYPVTYTVNANGCLMQATRAIIIGPPLNVQAGADTVLCPGSRQPFALRGDPTGGLFSGPGVSGSAATGFVFTPPAGLTSPITLTYTGSNGICTSTSTKQITVASEPLLQPTWVPVACDETRLAPLTLRFGLSSPSNLAGLTLVWEFGDGNQSAESSPTHTYATPGTYQPRVRLRYNTGRCETQAPLPLVEVQERKVPNIITPNGDPRNEYFKLGTDCPPHLEVFSRWGQKIFDSPTYHDEWNAPGQPTGVYYYLLTYPDGHRVKGWVEVMR